MYKKNKIHLVVEQVEEIVEKNVRRKVTEQNVNKILNVGPELLDISCVGTGNPPTPPPPILCCDNSCCCNCTPNMGIGTGGGLTPRATRVAEDDEPAAPVVEGRSKRSGHSGTLTMGISVVVGCCCCWPSPPLEPVFWTDLSAAIVAFLSSPACFKTRYT